MPTIQIADKPTLDAVKDTLDGGVIARFNSTEVKLTHTQNSGKTQNVTINKPSIVFCSIKPTTDGNSVNAYISAGSDYTVNSVLSPFYNYNSTNAPHSSQYVTASANISGAGKRGTIVYFVAPNDYVFYMNGVGTVTWTIVALT